MVVGNGVVVGSYGEPLINTLSCMTVSLITIVNSGNVMFWTISSDWLAYEFMAFVTTSRGGLMLIYIKLTESE